MKWFKKGDRSEGESATAPSPSSTSSTELNAFEVLELEKAGDVDALLRAVGRPATREDAARVDRAAVALAKLRDPRANDPLLAVLELTPYPITRERMINALGDIGDERAVTPMLEGLDPSVNVLRQMIIWAREYVRTGDPATIPDLDGVASAAASAGLVVGQAKKMLDVILGDHVTADLGALFAGTPSPGPSVGDLLSAAVQAAQFAITTAEALGKLGDGRAAAALRALLEDETLRDAADARQGLLVVDPETRQKYVTALRQMAARPGEKQWMAAAFDPAKYIDSLPQMAARLRQTSANALRMIGNAEAQPAAAMPEPTLGSRIEALIRQHLARLSSERGALPGVHELCDQLLTDDLLSFAVSSVAQRLPEALSTGTPSSSTKLTADWLVAVTVAPALTPEDVRGHFGGGYLALLDELAEPGLSQPGGRHVAHWIYCTEGDRAAVHMTLIPNAKVSPASAILATDLMTPTERQRVGL